MPNCDREYLWPNGRDFCKTHQRDYLKCVEAGRDAALLQNHELQKKCDLQAEQLEDAGRIEEGCTTKLNEMERLNGELVIAIKEAVVLLHEKPRDAAVARLMRVLGSIEKPLYDPAKDETLKRIDAGINAIKDMSTTDKPVGEMARNTSAGQLTCGCTRLLRCKAHAEKRCGCVCHNGHQRPEGCCDCTRKRVVRGPILMPEEITKYPEEWIVLSFGDPIKMLGHGKTPEEAIALSGCNRKDPHGWSLFYYDGFTGVRI